MTNFRFRIKSQLFIILPVVLFGFFFFARSSLAATPTIGNVSGTIQTGQILTITGTNMVQENTANWITTLSQSHGDGSSPSNDGWIPSDEGMDYVTSPRLIGTHAMHSQQTISAQNNIDYYNNGNYGHYSGIAGTYNYQAHNVGNTQYFRGYVMYDANCNKMWQVNDGSVAPAIAGVGGEYVKMLYWMSNSVYVQFVPNGSGNGWPDFMEVKLYDDSTRLPLPHKLVANRWYSIEAMSRFVSPGTLQASIWFDGTLLVNNDYPGGVLTMPVSGQWATNPGYFLLGFINVSPWSNVGTYDMWISGAVLSTSRVYPASIIEISGDGGSTWKYQPPTYLSDTSSTITADLPTLTASNYLLRVTNNQQQTSDVYDFSALPESDSTPPAVTDFVISSTSSFLTVPITTFTAMDNVGVTGYCLTEVNNSSGCSWSTTAQTQYAFTTEGAKTLYAWARDATNNISVSVNDSVTITLDTTPPSSPTGVQVALAQHLNNLASVNLSQSLHNIVSQLKSFLLQITN